MNIIKLIIFIGLILLIIEELCYRHIIFCRHYYIPEDKTITAETKDFHFECGFCHKEKIIPNDRI